MAILDPFTVGLPVKFGLCTFTLFPWGAEASQGNMANKSIPTQYELALNEGFLSYGPQQCYYQKSNYGLVQLGFSIYLNGENTIPKNVVVVPFTLPTGFTPAYTLRFTVGYATYIPTLYYSPSIAGAISCYMYPDGGCRVYTPLSDIRWIGGSVLFYAAGNDT